MWWQFYVRINRYYPIVFRVLKNITVINCNNKKEVPKSDYMLMLFKADYYKFYYTYLTLLERNRNINILFFIILHPIPTRILEYTKTYCCWTTTSTTYISLAVAQCSVEGSSSGITTSTFYTALPPPPLLLHHHNNNTTIIIIISGCMHIIYIMHYERIM